MQTENKNAYKGYSLFNDVEDETLQTYNRARVLVNMSEDNTKEGKISPKGAAMIIGYFNQFKDDDRTNVLKKFKFLMLRGGYFLDHSVKV